MPAAWRRRGRSKLPRSGWGRSALSRSAVLDAHTLRTNRDLAIFRLQKSVSALYICFSIIIIIVCRALCRDACRDVCRWVCRTMG